MFSINDKLDQLTPKQRQRLMFAAGIGVLVLVATLIATQPADDRAGSIARREALQTNLLTDVDPRDLGMDALARRLSTLEDSITSIQLRMQRLGLDDSAQAEEQTTLIETLRNEAQDQIAALRAEQQQMTQAVMEQIQSVSDRLNEINERAETAMREPPLPPPRLAPQPPPLDSVFSERMDEQGGGFVGSSSPPQIRTVRSEQAEASQEQQQVLAEERTRIRIPAGAILTGVLLNGMDAPTGRASREDPYPALLRLKTNAILPNRYRADVRECFLIINGYGDLGSERVYLRTESINCVRTDGGTVEVAIDGYATGEDGKLGLRGRLVSKQGQVIGQAMQVSFLQAFSQMFRTAPVASINTGNTDSVQYQDMFSSAALQGAAASGVGNAMERLAQYYMDMAEDMFPVLEIDAGREINIVLNRGVSLQLSDA